MDIRDYLNLKVEKYNNPDFIEDDPIKVPHMFKKKEDIEISAFLTSSIAWGNRKTIISNSLKMMDLMENDPYNFVINHSQNDLKKLMNFVHRTFNGFDFIQFIESLKHIYINHGGIENIFFENIKDESLASFNSHI